jgi:hypothetical protein
MSPWSVIPSCRKSEGTDSTDHGIRLFINHNTGTVGGRLVKSAMVSFGAMRGPGMSVSDILGL